MCFLFFIFICMFICHYIFPSNLYVVFEIIERELQFIINILLGECGQCPQSARPGAPHAPAALLPGLRAPLVRHAHRRHDEVSIEILIWHYPLHINVTIFKFPVFWQNTYLHTIRIYGGYLQLYKIILNFSQLILSQTLPIIVVDTIIIISWPISLGVAKLWSSFGSFVYFYIPCFQLFFCN